MLKQKLRRPKNTPKTFSKVLSSKKFAGKLTKKSSHLHHHFLQIMPQEERLPFSPPKRFSSFSKQRPYVLNISSCNPLPASFTSPRSPLSSKNRLQTSNLIHQTPISKSLSNFSPSSTHKTSIHFSFHSRKHLHRKNGKTHPLKPFISSKMPLARKYFFSTQTNPEEHMYHRIPEWKEQQSFRNPFLMAFQHSTFKYVLKNGHFPEPITHDFHKNLFCFYHGLRGLLIVAIVGTFILCAWFIFGDPLSEEVAQSDSWIAFKQKIAQNRTLDIISKFLFIGSMIGGGIALGFSSIGLAGLGTLFGISASLFFFFFDLFVDSGLTLGEHFMGSIDSAFNYLSEWKKFILPFIVANRNPSCYEEMTEEETEKLAHQLSVEKARMQSALEMFDLIEYVPLSGGCEQWRALSIQMFGHENNADFIRNEIIDWIRLNPDYVYKGMELQDHPYWIVFTKEYGNIDDPPPPYLQKVFEGMQEQFEEEYWDLQDALQLHPDTIHQLRVRNEEIGNRPLHNALWYYDYWTEARHPIRGGDLMWTFFPMQDTEHSLFQGLATTRKSAGIQRWKRIDTRRRMNYSLFFPHIPRTDYRMIGGSYADVDPDQPSKLSGTIWPLFTSGFVRKEKDTSAFVREKLLSIMRQEWFHITGEAFRREDELRNQIEWLSLLESNPNDAVVYEELLEKLHPNLPELRGNDVTLLAAAERFRTRIVVLTSRVTSPQNQSPLVVIEPKPQWEKFDEWAGFHLEPERKVPYVNTVYLSHHEKADIWRSVHKPPLPLDKWEEEKVYWRSQGRPIPSRESAYYMKWNRPSHLKSPGVRETTPYRKYDSAWSWLFYSMMIPFAL